MQSICGACLIVDWVFARSCVFLDRISSTSAELPYDSKIVVSSSLYFMPHVKNYLYTNIRLTLALTPGINY